MALGEQGAAAAHPKNVAKSPRGDSSTSVQPAAAAGSEAHPPVRAGCRAKLQGLSQYPELNGQEVHVLRFHAPTSRWIVVPVCSDISAWPESTQDGMRVGTARLLVARETFYERLGGGRGNGVADVLHHIYSFIDELTVLSRTATVDRTFAAESAARLAQVCTAKLTRTLRKATASCLEEMSPKAPLILPMLRVAVTNYHHELRPFGGSVSAYLTRGPVLHCAQSNEDASCAYRGAQMILSYMLHEKNRRLWPGVRETFMDEPEARATENLVPSVRRLQRSIHQAWRADYDPDGADQCKWTTWDKDGVVDLDPDGPCVAEYSGEGPTRHKNLKMMGASDVWAMLRWAGTRALIHDFIDGETRDERSAYDLLFDWVWRHFSKHAHQPAGATGPDNVHVPVSESNTPPLYLQWSGHAVCIVGAMRCQTNRKTPPTRHILVFNPEPSAEILYRALSGEEIKPQHRLQKQHAERSAAAKAASSIDTPVDKDEPSVPSWWPFLIFSGGVRRFTPYSYALDYNATTNFQGNGSENGPYQVVYVPPGWEQRADKLCLRHPEQVCIQHVGDKGPKKLRGIPENDEMFKELDRKVLDLEAKRQVFAKHVQNRLMEADEWDLGKNGKLAEKAVEKILEGGATPTTGVSLFAVSAAGVVSVDIGD